MFEAVLDHLKLQCSNRSDNLTSIHLTGEQLRHTLVHQLIDSFCQLFELHRIGIFDITEQLRRKARNADKTQLLAFGKGIADLKVPGIVQTDNIPRVGHIDHRLLLGHKGGRSRKFDSLARRHMQIGLVAFEHPGTDLQEGDTVPVVGVHIGVNLEDEAGHLRLIGHDVPLFGMARTG